MNTTEGISRSTIKVLSASLIIWLLLIAGLGYQTISLKNQVNISTSLRDSLHLIQRQQDFISDGLSVVDSLLTISQDSVKKQSSVIALQRQEIKRLQDMMPLRTKLLKKLMP